MQVLRVSMSINSPLTHSLTAHVLVSHTSILVLCLQAKQVNNVPIVLWTLLHVTTLVWCSSGCKEVPVQVPQTLRDDSPWVDSRQVSKSGFESGGALHFSGLSSPRGGHPTVLCKGNHSEKKQKNNNFSLRQAMDRKSPVLTQNRNSRCNLTSGSMAWQAMQRMAWPFTVHSVHCRGSFFFQQRTQTAVVEAHNTVWGSCKGWLSEGRLRQ